ncbi:MAG: DUF348 domain-containing protein [Ruminococcaceae bacterium]|nr:DUF348 domain-containing protein [Oscillospiraceae bacterium]
MLERLKYRIRSIMDLKAIRISLVMLLCAVTATAGVLLDGSVRTFSISDGENRYLVRSLSNNINDVIKMAGIEQENYRVVTLNKNSANTSVKIEYTFPVYITSGDKTVTFEATKGTVNEILSAAGYTVDQYDLIEPAADTLVSESTYIDYTNIDYVTGSYEEVIPCTTETVYAADRPLGSESIQYGSNGLQQVTYTEKLVNGVSAEKSVTGTVVLTAAVNNKKIVGTKQNYYGSSSATAVKTSNDVSAISTLTPASPIALDANGKPVNYTKKTVVQATAYTYTGNNCSTGVAPQPGYIAVNPAIIPYGTRMYIVSCDGRYTYGYAIAADTGGFIRTRPTNVDLFLSTPSACTAFGRRNVEIYFLP